MNDRIRELNKLIEAEKAKINSCKHEFGTTVFDPEKVREGYGYKVVAHGSDVWGEYAGYHNVDKPRWTRKCKLCGFEQHTYKQKPIVSGFEPEF